MATLKRNTAWDNETSPVVTPGAKRQKITLSTANKYVDKDIEILIAAQSEGPEGTCTVSGGGLTKGTATGGALTKGTATGGALTGGGLTAGNGSVGVNSTSVEFTESDSLPAGAKFVMVATGSGSVTREVVNLSEFSQDVNLSAFSQDVNRAAITDTHTAGYIPAGTSTPIAAGKETVSLAGSKQTVTLSKKSLPSESQASNEATKYYAIKEGSLGNAPTTGMDYTENKDAGTIIPAEGYLYIDEGYYEATKISLGQMIPDDTDYNNAGVSQIRSGYEAYNTDGEKLIGTMADVSITHSVTANGSASGITLGTKTASQPTSGAYITVTGKDSVNTTGTGYITKSASNLQSTDTEYYPVTITAAQAPALVGNGDAEVTDGQTISVSGSGTPVKNTTSGKYEVSVTGSNVITGTFTSAGYVKAGKAIDSATVTASGKAIVDAGSVTNNTTIPSGSTSTATVDAGKAIKISAGYYPSDVYYTAQSSSASASGTKEITSAGDTSVAGYATAHVAEGTVSCADNSSTVSATSVSVQAGSYNATSKTVGVTVGTSATLKHTITKTAGYITAGTVAGTQDTITNSQTNFTLAAYDGTYTVTEITA